MSKRAIDRWGKGATQTTSVNTLAAQQAAASAAYGGPSSTWTVTIPSLKDYTDEAIMEEYIKRFSPLAKAMSEENE